MAMIQSGTVTMAKAAPRLSAPWMACSSLLFLLQCVYPMVKVQVEQNAWASSLHNRHDGWQTSLVIDGTLGFFGLVFSFLVSSGMYVLALNHWRDKTTTWRDLAVGGLVLHQFLTISLAASVAQQLLWHLLRLRLEAPFAAFFQLGLTWLVITPFVFVVPLIVDRRLGVIRAAAESFLIVRSQPGAALALVLSAGFWSMIGLIVLVVGMIWTLPTYQLAISRAYLDCFEDPRARKPAENTSHLL